MGAASRARLAALVHSVPGHSPSVGFWGHRTSVRPPPASEGPSVFLCIRCLALASGCLCVTLIIIILPGYFPYRAYRLAVILPTERIAWPSPRKAGSVTPIHYWGRSMVDPDSRPLAISPRRSGRRRLIRVHRRRLGWLCVPLSCFALGRRPKGTRSLLFSLSVSEQSGKGVLQSGH